MPQGSECTYMYRTAQRATLFCIVASDRTRPRRSLLDHRAIPGGTSEGLGCADEPLRVVLSPESRRDSARSGALDILAGSSRRALWQVGVLCRRLPDPRGDLARADGRYLRLLKQSARINLLVLDDWGLARLNSPQQSDILELLDDRHQHRSTIVTSQLPVEHWHETMADPTLADAILDRLVHNAHHLKLTGESMRKQTADLQ